VCVCVREREIGNVRVCVCVREREIMNVCVCVFVREREKHKCWNNNLISIDKPTTTFFSYVAGIIHMLT
jgi:hypothetical protein